MLEIVKRSAFEPCLGSVDVGSVLENPHLGLSLAPSANLKISLRCIGNMQYISHPPLPLSSLSVTPRPRTNAILVFIRNHWSSGRQRVNGEGQSRLGFLASGRHTLSHSVLWQSCHIGHWRPDWKTTLDTVSVCFSAVNVMMLLCTQQMLTFIFMLPRPCQERKLACNFKLGWLGKGGGREQCRCQKAHGGLSAMGFACLRVVVWLEIIYLGLTMFIHEWILVCEKADGCGRWREGWRWSSLWCSMFPGNFLDRSSLSWSN